MALFNSVFWGVCSFDVIDYVYTHIVTTPSHSLDSYFLFRIRHQWPAEHVNSYKATLQSLKLYTKPRKMPSVLIVLDMSIDFDIPHFHSCQLEHREIKYYYMSCFVFLIISTSRSTERLSISSQSQYWCSPGVSSGSTLILIQNL